MQARVTFQVSNKAISIKPKLGYKTAVDLSFQVLKEKFHQLKNRKMSKSLEKLSWVLLLNLGNTATSSIYWFCKRNKIGSSIFIIT